MELDAHRWTSEQVGEWLKKHGFEQYSTLLAETHKIDGLSLLQLSEKDLKGPPLNIKTLGDIKRMVTKIHRLKAETIEKHPNLYDVMFQDREVFFEEMIKNRINTKPSQKNSKKLVNKISNDEKSRTESNLSRPPISRNLTPDFYKLFMAFLYMMFAFMMTTFVMVIVHDRVPNMEKYPPLPDIVLDNVPYMPWAFGACETIILTFATIVTMILFFHKHRFIIARRLFAMLGTVFLLRCITMLITSLSVPGTHLQCEPRTSQSFKERVKMAFQIYTGMGMSIKGVKTCGDYLFSGHTVVVTIFNFFINEYTNMRFSGLHTICWVGNFFAIFFILAAHEHYSIDVFIAFYITSRLFLYYHSLANNRVLMQRDARTQIWFPLFAYFEASIDGRVPNDYEPPWTTFYKCMHPHGQPANEAVDGPSKNSILIRDSRIDSRFDTHTGNTNKHNASKNGVLSSSREAAMTASDPSVRHRALTETANERVKH